MADLIRLAVHVPEAVNIFKFAGTLDDLGLQIGCWFAAPIDFEEKWREISLSHSDVVFFIYRYRSDPDSVDLYIAFDGGVTKTQTDFSAIVKTEFSGNLDEAVNMHINRLDLGEITQVLAAYWSLEEN